MKSRPIIILMMLGTLLVTAMPALADEAGGGKGKMGGLPIRWKATSPAIHEGDQYNLLVTNTGEEAQGALIRTVIMDHRNHANTDVIDEQVELEPGEEREFSAVNDYGDANHFNTLIGSETKDLDLAISVTDAAGAETARFNQKAFLIQEGTAAGAKGKGKGEKAHAHAHDEGFAASVPAVLGETARLAPLSIGLLATTGLGLYTVRRRRAQQAVAAGPLAETVAVPLAWRMAAVIGLALSAALHIGLAPVHFAEATEQGVFFCVAGVIAAVVAAAILVWPSRLAYLAGAGISLALILLWALFLLVPPPGTEAAEAINLIGLLTKATEVVAATACIVLWFRARQPHQPN